MCPDQGNQVGAFDVFRETFVTPMALIHGNKVDATDAARILGKSPATIRQYGSRGIKLASGERFHLRPVGLDHRNMHLYSLSDLRTVAAATRARGRSNKVLVAA